MAASSPGLPVTPKTDPLSKKARPYKRSYEVYHSLFVSDDKPSSVQKRDNDDDSRHRDTNHRGTTNLVLDADSRPQCFASILWA